MDSVTFNTNRSKQRYSSKISNYLIHPIRQDRDVKRDSKDKTHFVAVRVKIFGGHYLFVFSFKAIKNGSSLDEKRSILCSNFSRMKSKFF